VSGASRHFVVPDDAAGARLDAWLAAQETAPSRSQLKHAAEEGRLLVDGETARVSHRLRGGEAVELRPDGRPASDGAALPEDIPLRVLFEDEHLLAVDKPAGMVVHPAAGNPDGTLVNAVLGRYVGAALPGDAGRAGIVHRLDRDTSGVILVARSVVAHEALSRQFHDRQVSKTYLALARGRVAEALRIDAAIGRHPRDRKKMSVAARVARKATTDIRPLEYFGAATLVEARPLTGRTHQIRVHLASRGWPIVADPIYGGRAPVARGAWASVDKALAAVPRLALHAAAIEFDHPASRRRVRVEAPLAEDLEGAFAVVRNAASKVVDSQ
jgi:23S rRNA pseudouridine1911/1915/1917 synthase